MAISKIAFVAVPTLSTIGVDPFGKAVTSPIVIVPAGPCGPGFASIKSAMSFASKDISLGTSGESV